ncbi:MAG: hypothetical protein Q8O55_01855 [Dehalococcoidales bacterium]|nr:hypothetical protein [Dehalococcoidales bacterium]
MKVLEKIKALFKRGKVATKVEPKPATEVAEKKTTEASGQEGAKR